MQSFGAGSTSPIPPPVLPPPPWSSPPVSGVPLGWAAGSAVGACPADPVGIGTSVGVASALPSCAPDPPQLTIVHVRPIASTRPAPINDALVSRPRSSFVRYTVYLPRYAGNPPAYRGATAAAMPNTNVEDSFREPLPTMPRTFSV